MNREAVEGLNLSQLWKDLQAKESIRQKKEAIALAQDYQARQDSQTRPDPSLLHRLVNSVKSNSSNGSQSVKEMKSTVSACPIPSPSLYCANAITRRICVLQCISRSFHMKMCHNKGRWVRHRCTSYPLSVSWTCLRVQLPYCHLDYIPPASSSLRSARKDWRLSPARMYCFPHNNLDCHVIGEGLGAACFCTGKRC